MKKNNKGFSLIEVVVVMAIMAILIGSSVSIYSSIGRNRQKKLVDTTKDVINTLKSDSLSKEGSYRLVIKKSGDAYVGVTQKKNASDVWEDKKTTQISDVGTITEGSNSVTETDWIILAFNKSDGSFQTVAWADSTGTTSTDVKDLVLEYKGYKTTLHFVKNTGKYYVG